MTTQNEQTEMPIDQGVSEPAVDIVDITDAQVDVGDQPDIIQDAIDQSLQRPEQPQAPAAQPAAQPAAAPVPPQEDYSILSQQNAQLQSQLNNWTQWQQQQEMERSLIERSNVMRSQLENQGYTEDQIDLAVTQQQAHERQTNALQAELQRTKLHEEGKYRAAMYYAKQHGVDSEQLLPYNSPQEMETRAREMARIGELEAKLAKYEKAQVPAQNFDNSTSQVAAASSEDTWLEKFNAGDRSPEAQAAARRAAGLG